ncbi:MAG TPA: hypothetical protein VNN80_00945, partial [Polyangiaceae bacterium]|nr:hypothetical protein [Polyangiaceae bacterium]
MNALANGRLCAAWIVVFAGACGGEVATSSEEMGAAKMALSSDEQPPLDEGKTAEGKSKSTPAVEIGREIGATRHLRDGDEERLSTAQLLR